MGFYKSSIAVDSFCAAVQECSSINFSPIVYDMDWNANRRNAFILDRT